jgi:hypothetical protein
VQALVHASRGAHAEAKKDPAMVARVKPRLEALRRSPDRA